MSTRTEQPTISEILEAAREGKGLSQRQAAAKLGTTPGTYRQWLRGQVPGLERVPSFVEFTGKPKLNVVMAIVEAEDRLTMGGYVAVLDQPLVAA